MTIEQTYRLLRIVESLEEVIPELQTAIEHSHHAQDGLARSHLESDPLGWLQAIKIGVQMWRVDQGRGK